MLATIDTVDFLYTCPGHLVDREFATRIGANETRSVGVTEEKIAKVKEEWEEKQKQKLEKEKEKKEKEKEESPKDGEREISKSPNVSGPSPTPPTHERYALHRDYFAS